MTAGKPPLARHGRGPLRDGSFARGAHAELSVAMSYAPCCRVPLIKKLGVPSTPPHPRSPASQRSSRARTERAAR
jgi:hypothetical protein